MGDYKMYSCVGIETDGVLINAGELTDFLAVYLNEKLEEYLYPAVFIFNTHFLVINKNMNGEVKDKLFLNLDKLVKSFSFGYRVTQLEDIKIPDHILEGYKDITLNANIYGTDSICSSKLQNDIEYLEKISSHNTVFKLNYLIDKLINEYKYLMNYLDNNIVIAKEKLDDKSIVKEFNSILDDIAFVLYTIYLNNSPVIKDPNKLKYYKQKLDNDVIIRSELAKNEIIMSLCDDNLVTIFKIMCELNISFKYIIRLNHNKKINKDYLKSQYNKIKYLIYKIFNYLDPDLLCNYEYKDPNYLKLKHKIDKLESKGM